MHWIANPENREFESHPLFQFMRGSFNGKITGFHPVVKGSIPLPRTNLALKALLAMHGSCKPENTVRFCMRAPSFRILTANQNISLFWL